MRTRPVLRYIIRAFAFVVLTGPTVSSAMPLRSDYSDGSCQDSLSHPGLRRAVEVLNKRNITSGDKAHALVMLATFADSHVSSFEYLLALEPKAIDIGLRTNLSYEERAGLITDYLSRDENAVLAAEHVYYLWEDLLTTITQNPRAVAKARALSAERKLARILKLARTHGKNLMAAWSLHVWDSEGHGPQEVDWIRPYLDRAVSLSTADLRSRKPHHEDPRKQLTERNEYVGRLIKILATPVRDESLAALTRFDFESDQRALRVNRTYAADMASLFNIEGDDPKVPFGNFRIALQYRMTKLLETATGGPRLPSSVALDSLLGAWTDAERASREVERRYVDPSYDLAPDQRAVVTAVETDPYFRATLFKNSPLTADLLEPRAWLSVSDPSEVRAAVEALDKSSAVYATFAKDLKATLGIAPAQLATDATFYTYYPDEIWDALPNAHRINDPETTLRFARREPSDLGLGDKTGDCTAVGGVNYGNSLTWFYNSAYQILRFKRGGRWLGKLNISLFEIDRHPALKIDAIEVNPAAQDEYGPQRADAELALRDALDYVYRMGDRLQRRVYAEPSSNSFWVNKLTYDLRHESEANAALDDIEDGFDQPNPPPPKTGLYIFDQGGVRRALGLADNVPLKPYYQTAERAFVKPIAFSAHTGAPAGADAKLRAFVTQIVAPARAANEHLDSLLTDTGEAPDGAARELILVAAAKLILADAGRVAAVKEMFGLPAQFDVSPKLIAKRLAELNPGQDPTKGERSGGFVLNSATYLMHVPDAKR